MALTFTSNLITRNCDADKKGNYAIQNSPSDVWNAFRLAMRARTDIEVLRAIMTLKGFGRTTGTAKRASAVLRMFKPDEWGGVDWRAAAMVKQLEPSYHKIHLTTTQKYLVVQTRDGYYSSGNSAQP